MGRGVLGRRSESRRELLGLSGVSEGSLFSSEAVVVELAVGGVGTSGDVPLVRGAWELGGVEVALVLAISCTWSLFTSCWLAGSQGVWGGWRLCAIETGVCWLLWSQPSEGLPLQAGGFKEDCSLQDVFYSRLGHDPSINAIVACGAMMVNHHLHLLLRVLSDLFIVTCAESSAWSSGSSAFSNIAGVQLLGVPHTIRKVVFVPSKCLSFWDFCLVVMAFCPLVWEVISGADLLCVTRAAALLSLVAWEYLWL